MQSCCILVLINTFYGAAQTGYLYRNMKDTSHPINASDFSVAWVRTSLSTSSTIRCHESTIPTIAGINGKIHSSWVVLHLHGVWWSCLSGMFWVQQLGDMDLWWKKAWTQPTETVGTWSFSCFLMKSEPSTCVGCGFLGFRCRRSPVEFLHVENAWEHFLAEFFVSQNGTFQGTFMGNGGDKKMVNLQTAASPYLHRCCVLKPRQAWVYPNIGREHW